MPTPSNQSPIQPARPSDDTAKQHDVVREAGKYRPGQEGDEAVDQARRDNADAREAGNKDPKQGQQQQRMSQRDENPIDDEEKGDIDPNDSILVDGGNDIDSETAPRSSNPAKPGQPVR